MKSRALDEGNRGKPKEVENLLEQPNYLVEEKYPTPPELDHPFFFMSTAPPGSSPLRLPLGDFVFYPTGRPCLRLLLQQIAASGYSVSGYPLSHPDLSSLPPGVWHCVVVIGDFILFIVAPTAPSLFSSSSSDQSGYESSPKNEPDSDAFDPPSDQSGYGSSDNPDFPSDQSGYASPDEPDSDNVDPDFPEDGYCPLRTGRFHE